MQSHSVVYCSPEHWPPVPSPSVYEHSCRSNFDTKLGFVRVCEGPAALFKDPKAANNDIADDSYGICKPTVSALSLCMKLSE